MSAQNRLEQLDDGVEREFLQVITNHEKVLQVLTKMVKSMKNEALILVPNDMTMIGLNRLGIIDHIIKAPTKKVDSNKNHLSF